MFTDRDLVTMIEVAQELRAAIKRGETPDVQAVDDLCGFVLAQNEAFPDEDEDDEEHVCKFGPFERAPLAGTLHRKCAHPGCKLVSLDSEDD